MKTKLATVDTTTCEALQEGFKNHYLGLAAYYNQLMKSKDAQERQLGIFFCKLEYENLYNGLQICLDKQESISIYFCLDKYFELINDIKSNLKIAELIYHKLEKYPKEFLQNENGYEVVIAIDYLANCYLQTKDYQKAQELYQKELTILSEVENTELRRKKNIYC